MLRFFINQITSQSFLLFSQLPNLKISLFAQPHKFHIKITDLVLLLLTILLQLPDFKLVLLVITQVMSFKVLYL